MRLCLAISMASTQSFLNISSFSLAKIKHCEVNDDNVIINNQSKMLVFSGVESIQTQLLRFYEILFIYLNGKLNYKEPKSIMDHVQINNVFENINNELCFVFKVKYTESKLSFVITDNISMSSEAINFDEVNPDNVIINNGKIYALSDNILHDTFAFTCKSRLSDKIMVGVMFTDLTYDILLAMCQDQNMILISSQKNYTINVQLFVENNKQSMVITKVTEIEDKDFEIVNINKKEFNIKITRQDLINKYPESKNDIEKLFTEDQILHEKTINVLESITFNMAFDKFHGNISFRYAENSGVLTIPRNEHFVKIDEALMLSSDNQLTNIVLNLNKSQMLGIINNQKNLALGINIGVDKSARLISIC